MYHLYTTKQVITKKPGVVLLNPISKEKKWVLNHKDVILEKLLGKENFGGVLKGILKDKTAIAVKTRRSSSGTESTIFTKSQNSQAI